MEGRKKGEKKEYNLALGRKGTYGIATSNIEFWAPSGLFKSQFRVKGLLDASQP